jgi:ABC-type sugar transport system ATPase subunit
MSTIVEFQQVSKHFGRNILFDDLTVQLDSGRFSVIFGAPASGKSTLLRILTGLDKPSSGHVFLRSEDATNIPAGERNIGYVPQTFALYPHYSVFDNIAYPLRLNRMAKKSITPIVEQAAERLSITDLLDKRPDQLSGGQKQRVAIARGIVKDTDIFVLDDPLTGLDFKLREQLFDDLKQMQADLEATFIYTTSDTLETQMLAQDVHVLDAGHIIESGDFEQIFKHPQQRRSMALLGFPKTNLIAGTWHYAGADPKATCPLFDVPIKLVDDAKVYDKQVIDLAVRPEHMVIKPTAEGYLTMTADITLIENLGGEVVIYLEGQDLALLSTMSQAETGGLEEGSVTIGVRPEHVIVFDRDTGVRLGRGHVDVGIRDNQDVNQDVKQDVNQDVKEEEVTGG